MLIGIMVRSIKHLKEEIRLILHKHLGNRGENTSRLFEQSQYANLCHKNGCKNP